MKHTLLWAVPLGILLVVLAEWALLANPGGRLVGLVLLSVLLGFIGVFALAPVTLAAGATSRAAISCRRGTEEDDADRRRRIAATMRAYEAALEKHAST
ncbi:MULTISPECIES: hypothetical protein [unclassified Spirillospora]|uniref:hypothetical protein n=1 Tax=unclassified Spirillospora TaxID=2642701 RepID=UPI0037132015